MKMNKKALRTFAQRAVEYHDRLALTFRTAAERSRTPVETAERLCRNACKAERDADFWRRHVK